MSSAVLEARAVIRAEDRTKAAFDSIEARISKLVGRVAAIDRVMGRVEQIGGPIAKATQEVRKFEIAAESMALIDRQAAMVRRSFAETATSIEKATAAATKFGRANIEAHGAAGGGARGGHDRHGRFGALREIGEGIAPMVGLGVAYEGYEGVREAVHGGFERQHERTRMSTAGMSPAEIAEAETQSAQLAAKFPAVGQTEIMHLLRNTRSVVGNYEEAAKVVLPLLDLRVVAQGAHPGEDMTEEFDQLIKGMEIKGVTQDPEKFRSYINSMGKAVNAFGDTLRPTDFYEMFKYGRASTAGFSQDYMMQVAPTLAQEMKGSSAGVANAAFFRAIVGGRMEKGALSRLEDLDLVDKSKLKVPKGGHIASAAGAIVGTELAQLNPYEWVNKILLPAMAKKGIVDPQKIQEVIGSLFSNQVAAQMVGIYATQQGRIEKDRGVIAGTMETDAAARQIMEHDPIVAGDALKKAIEGLASTIADKTLNLAGSMGGAAQAITGFTARIEHAYERQEHGDVDPPKGQQVVNGIGNAIRAAVNGWDDGGSTGPREDGDRASIRATAKARAAAASDLDDKAAAAEYDAYENTRNAARLMRDAEAHEPQTFWQSVWWQDDQGPIMRHHADSLSDAATDAQNEANRLRGQADLDRAAGRLVSQLDDVSRQIDSARTMAPSLRLMDRGDNEMGPAFQGSGSLRSVNSQRQALASGVPSMFPMEVGYDGFAGAPFRHIAMPPAAQDNQPIVNTLEELKSALNSGSVKAQMDPNSKATVEVTVKVEPSSDLIHAAADAKAAASSGNIQASVGTSGSVGKAYPQTAPRGRSGFAGRGD